MAEPIQFKEANFTWKGPTPDIGDLSAYLEREPGKPPLTISCWKLTQEEFEEIGREGVVWLLIWGHHTPVSVTGQSPFGGAPGMRRQPPHCDAGKIRCDCGRFVHVCDVKAWWEHGQQYLSCQGCR